MTSFRKAALIWTGVSLLAAAVALYVVHWRSGVPERRAEAFIEQMIIAPDATDELGALADLTPGARPDALVDGVAARTALAYLRTRARLGARVRINAKDGQMLDDHRQVTVTAREGLAGVEALRFQVTLVQREDEWRVARVSAE